MQNSESPKNDTRKVFLEKGSCSHTFFYLLNREFGHNIAEEEQALDPLAGGIMQKGHQCGMLWGAAMAVGAEAYRRCEDPEKAVALAINAAKAIVDSFIHRTHTPNCRKITRTDFSNPLQMTWYLLFRSRGCFKLAEAWAPEAIEAAKEALDTPLDSLPDKVRSCAAEVVLNLGGTEEQATMAAGLAGGIGFSGEACGALGAAVWMHTLEYNKNHKKKAMLSNPKAKAALERFKEATGGEMLCHRICGKYLESVQGHSEYLENGACARLIDTLSR